MIDPTVQMVKLDNHTTPEEVARWCGGEVTILPKETGTGLPIYITVPTDDGPKLVAPGEWICKTASGGLLTAEDITNDVLRRMIRE